MIARKTLRGGTLKEKALIAASNGGGGRVCEEYERKKLL